MAGLQPLWEMSEKELGWLEGLRFSLSAELPAWRGGGPWRLRYEDAVGDGDRDLTRVVREEVSFDEIAAVDLDRMAVQLCSEVEDVSPSPAEVVGIDPKILADAYELIRVARYNLHMTDWKGAADKWCDGYHSLPRNLKVAEDKPPDIDQRGFKIYADFTDTYGANVRVKESSRASESHVWFFVDGGRAKESGKSNDGAAHLDADGAVIVRDALSAWLRDWTAA